MTLKDLKLKISYRSENEDELVRDFYIPVLSNAVLYKRAVGYFSSNLLLQLSKGISKLIDNGGQIKIIVSPELYKKDIEAIIKGYELRKQVVYNVLSRDFEEPNNDIQRERYNYLAHLISNNQLDIKVALMNNLENPGIYHEKIGIVKDKMGNKIAFTGSLNETECGVYKNFESIDVYCSWIGGTDLKRIKSKDKDFNKLWCNETERLIIYDFPEAVEKKILKYKKNNIVREEKLLEYNTNKPSINILNKTNTKNYPKYPNWLTVRDYQQKAVNAWKKNNYVGLLNMATGTGKTITALSGITQLWNDLNDKLVIIIVCPYTHLVEQWRDDVIKFNMEPIIAYSSSDQHDWYKKMTNKIHRYNLNIIKNICIITTNGTYKTEKFQELINNIDKNVVFVVDEAHNAGASGFLKKMNFNFEYRLALSATPTRHFDEEGTEKIINYFGKEVYYFGLKKAIKNGFLTRYFYYPQIIYLTDNEYDEYVKISSRIYRNLVNTKDGVKLNEYAKMLLIKRARLIAGAKNKLNKLRELIKDKKNSNFNLVYCGATSVDSELRDNEMKQIEAVTRILGNELNMKVAKFTAEESMEERRRIIKEFSDGESLQVIVAIKCLDEGVNIPSIQNAYILASSTNPREFIQRRGRVLRKYDGKNFAHIYDFITLPRSINEVSLLDQNLLKYDISIIRKEIKRAKEFANLAENNFKSISILEKIEEAYKKYFKEGLNLNG